MHGSKISSIGIKYLHNRGVLIRTRKHGPIVCSSSEASRASRSQQTHLRINVGVVLEVLVQLLEVYHIMNAMRC